MTGPNLPQLQEIYGVKLSWDGHPIEPETSATARFQRYLEQRPALRDDKVMAEPKAGKPKARRPNNRPRTLSWVEERKVAIFVELRRLEGRCGKNAKADVCATFTISPATYYRILKRHRAGAKPIARALKKAGKKRFKKSVQPTKRVMHPDFSDWGPDRY